MDSLSPLAIQSETVKGASGPAASRTETTDEASFAAELTRQIEPERRSHLPRTADNPSLEEAASPTEPEAEPQTPPPASKPRATLAEASLEAGQALLAGLGATVFAAPATAETPTAETPTAEATAPTASTTPPMKPESPALTEEQVNLQKLTKYLMKQSSEAAKAPESRTQRAGTPPSPTEAPPPSSTEAPLPSPAAPSVSSATERSVRPEPRAEAPVEAASPAPTERTEAMASQTSVEGKATPKTEGSDPFDLGRPLEPSTVVSPSPSATAELEAAARDAQLRAAAQRTIAEARQRMLRTGRSSDGQLSMTLTLEEASVPMRVRFAPDGQGGQNVAFLVSTPKDMQRLRKLMPEIETVLTELPVEVSDVKVDVDSFRDTRGGDVVENAHERQRNR